MASTTRQVTLPSYWYRGAHGDPVPVFDAESVALVLHEDGTVTWHHVSDSEREAIDAEGVGT